jgi:hypothetical protein
MNEIRRYKKSRVRNKQPLIRSLKTFSSQYKYIYFENELIDFNEEPVFLHFSDEFNNNLYNVFSRDDLIVDLKNYKLICEAIDEMFGIGQTDWKKDLKKEIYDCGGEDFNYFLDDRFEYKAKQIISEYSSNKKIYTYIKNYVSFYNSGVYGSAKRDVISIKPISYKDSIEKKLDFLLKAKKLYLRINDEIESMHDIYEDEVNEWLKNPNFDYDALDVANNSYFHPIDDSTQSDTLHMIERKNKTMYSEDTMHNIQNWKDNIDSTINHMIKELDHFSKAFNIRVDFKKLKDFENFELPRFEETYCWDLIDDLRTELIDLKEYKEEFENDYIEFFAFLKKELKDNYYLDWLEEQIELWYKELFNSKYTHKISELEKNIKESLKDIELGNKEKKVIEKINTLFNSSRKVLLDKRVNIDDVILQLDDILEKDYFEKDKEKTELTDREIFQKCYDIKMALDKKNNYLISDVDYVIQLGLVKNEEEFISIQQKGSIVWNKMIEEDINLF